ncbi:MAG: DUF4230 domain-containing protein [Ginsengibacter sp.]
MSKFLKNILFIAAFTLLVIFIFQKINILPSVKDIFSSKPVLIEETPILIHEINALAQLMTVTYTDEIVMDTVKLGIGIPSLVPVIGGSILSPALDKLVIIGRGKVIAGTDLKKLKEQDIIQTEDSINVSLPASTILETILNPSDFETFIEKGNWNDAAVVALKVKIRNELNNRAEKENILDQSNDRTRMIIESFLKNAGFRKVEIQFN